MKAIEIINILRSEYNNGFSGYIGFRKPTDDESYNVGDQCRNSYDWDYEYDLSSYNTENPIELDGTCATGTYIEDDEDAESIIAEMMESNFNSYAGNEQIVIFGQSAEYGADENEVIIKNATVIAIIK